MTILLTKVRPPQRRKDILHRVRLVDTIHQNLHRKLTFVSAPAGYGKTTLLVDFAADVDAMVCWYLISPEDTELVQFVRHIVAAFQQQIPKFGKDLEETLNSPGASPDAGSLATEIINEVERLVDDFCVLVLDDYHLAGENEEIVDLIENLLEHLPDQLRILIGSRSVYGIPTANLYIRDELVTISADELRFRADELQRLVLQNYHVRLSNESATELARRADGWIVAIMLAVRSLKNGALPKFVGATEQVYEYLAEEVVNRQDSELREFMYATSILGDFDEALCNYVLERKDSAELLRALEDRNLFVSRTESAEGFSYRYHQLFSEFLQDHFEQSDPERMHALQSRAAGWYQEREQWETAIRQKLDAREYIEAAQWIDSIASQFYAQGRQGLLKEWHARLEAADKDFEKHAPRLLLFEAKALGNQGDYKGAEKLLNVTTSVLSKKKDRETLANAIITRGMIQRSLGNFSEALKLATKAQRILSKGEESVTNKHQRHQAERLKGLATISLREPQKGIRLLSSAAEGFRELVAKSNGSRKLDFSFDLAETLTDIGVSSLSIGDMDEGQKTFQEALNIHVKSRPNHGSLAAARNNIAYVLHQTGRYKEAWNEYSLALEHAQASNRVEAQIGILHGQAELLFDISEYEEAKSRYEQAHSLGLSSKDVLAIYSSLAGLSQIQHVQGNHSEAVNLLRDAASHAGHSLDEPFYSRRLGAIYLDMGQSELAVEEFEKALGTWKEGQSPQQDHVHAAFLAFRALSKLGKQEEALEQLQLALKGAAQLGYDQFLVLAARPVLEELREAQKVLASSQLKDLIKRASDFQTGMNLVQAEQISVEVPGLHLEVHALGADQVRKDGELLPSAVWRSSRARALFYYIIDRKRVRKEDVGLDFWPEFNPGKISSNFHATLWRVRQALGDKDLILFEDDHYMLHPAVTYWYDVAEFENYIRQAAAKDLSDSERTEILRQATRLYRGDYLNDVYLDWSDRRREELQYSYLQALISLAELEQKNRRFEEARGFYEKALNVDPYRDKVHLALMDCLVHSGAPSAAKAHFQDYKAMLREELNAEPLPELQSFYDRLPV